MTHPLARGHALCLLPCLLAYFLSNHTHIKYCVLAHFGVQNFLHKKMRALRAEFFVLKMLHIKVRQNQYFICVCGESTKPTLKMPIRPAMHLLYFTNLLTKALPFYVSKYNIFPLFYYVAQRARFRQQRNGKLFGMHSKPKSWSLQLKDNFPQACPALKYAILKYPIREGRKTITCTIMTASIPAQMDGDRWNENENIIAKAV